MMNSTNFDYTMYDLLWTNPHKDHDQFYMSSLDVLYSLSTSSHTQYKHYFPKFFHEYKMSIV